MHIHTYKYLIMCLNWQYIVCIRVFFFPLLLGFLYSVIDDVRKFYRFVHNNYS